MKNKLIKIFMLICTLILLLCFSLGMVACGQDQNVLQIDIENLTFNRTQTQVGYITFDYEEGVVFECEVSKGTFSSNEDENILQKTVQKNEKLYWLPRISFIDREEYGDKNDTVYIDVVAKIDNEIKGYAVIELSSDEDVNYTAKVLQNKVFDKKEQVSNEQIITLIENCKDPEILMVDCTAFIYSPAMSAVWDIPLYYNNEDAVFECKTDNGSFVYNSKIDTLTLPYNGKFTWTTYDYDYYQIEETHLAYVDVVLKVNDEIRGYIVIEMRQDEQKFVNAYKIKSKIFTEDELKNGQITEQKVQQLIDSHKGDS